MGNETAKHTPGPWEDEKIYSDGGYNHTRITMSNGRTFALFGVYGFSKSAVSISHGEAEANARLIATAPEMFEVLEAIDYEGRDSTYPGSAKGNGDVVIPSHLFDLVQIVIAKAQGE